MSDNTTKNESAQIHRRWIYPLAGILMMLCIGNVYSWSVFAKPLWQEGFSQAQTTLAFQLSIVIFTIAMIFAGRWQDKVGPKPVAIFSGIMMGLGFVLIKWFGHTPTGMIICFSGIVGIGMGAGYVTPLATALKWYPDKRGLMSGLVVMGMGAGSIFGGMGGPILIAKYGVWNTFLVFGIVFGAIITACGAILKNPPEGYKPPAAATSNATNDEPQAAKNEVSDHDFSAKEMLKTPAFYLLWLVFLIGTGGGLMVISQASNFGVDIVKLTPVIAGSVIMVLGIFNGLGRPSCGFLSDKIGRRNVIFVAFAIQLIALVLVLPYANSYLIYAIGVSLMGFSYGGFLGTMPSITSDYYGLKNVGFNYAWVYTGWGAAGYFGPQVAKVMVGGSLDKGDWNKAFYFLAAACVIGMILWFFTKPPVKPAHAK
ncbi:MAG: OFA family MFS transporter [Elusimicrobia bacterium]|nr:OFA family MFS transporter [Elusimicrobiota bacterium]